MRQSVLVTGAAGFVGRYVAQAFENKGYQVHGLGWGKFPDFRDWGLTSWNESEVSLESLVEFAGKPDVIVHCAGGSAVGYSIEHPRQDFCLTVDTTSHVLEYIRRHSPETRLVYPSTAAVYGQVESVPITESASLKPVSPYGVHKLMAEDLCRLYATQFGLQIAIVRLFSIYGKGLRKQLLWDACQKFNRGESTFFGTGEEIRDWLYVCDAAALLMMAEVHASTACPVVNGGSGTGTNVAMILNALALAFSVDIKPAFSSQSKPGDPDALVANIESAKSWGWLPQADCVQAVAEYAKWFLQEGN